MISFFTIYVRPLLDYGIVVWAPVSVDGIDRLEAVQRSFLKKIVGYEDISYPERLRSSGLVSLRCRRATTDLLFIYKILTGSINVDINRHLLLRPPSATRGNPAKLEAPRVRLESTRRFLVPRVVNAWNSLPDDIIASQDILTFRKSLLKYIKNPIVMQALACGRQ